MKDKAWVSDESIYEEALDNPKEFWAKHAEEGIDWYEKWDETYTEEPYNYEWFEGGKLNLAYNAVDRHVENGNGDKNAIIWEPEPTDEETIRMTYSELQSEVSKFAKRSRRLWRRKGRQGRHLHANDPGSSHCNAGHGQSWCGS